MLTEHYSQVETEVKLPPIPPRATCLMEGTMVDPDATTTSSSTQGW